LGVLSLAAEDAKPTSVVERKAVPPEPENECVVNSQLAGLTQYFPPQVQIGGSAQPESVGKAAVWIVDDSPLELKVAVTSLGAAFTIRSFEDGATALEALEIGPPPDVMLLDWLMPGISGIDVCRFLRGKPSTSELSVLLLTSQMQTEQIVEGLAAGANDYLIKPYAPAELLARVTSLVRAKLIRERAQGAEHEAAADALSRTDLRYHALIEGMPDLVLVIRLGRIAFVNTQAADLFAAGDASRLIGQPVESIIHPEDREVALARIAMAIANGKAPLIERRMLRYDGSQVDVDLSAQAIVFGGEVAVVAVARDISEQKKIQNQLLVAERMASVGMLAAGVAHEINNPLASVIANLDYALGELEIPSFDPEELREALKEAREASERVRQIVRDLKIVSTSDDVERRGPVDVQRVLESSLRMAFNEIRHRARLVKDYGNVPPVLANDSRLGQVFLNLIINAAQAIPEGRAEGNEVRITTRMFEGKVAVEVRDTGGGIAPAAMKNLFTPFFTTKAIGQGTGIGLSICHRIVTSLGGEISVESELGVGSTFRVVLPVAAASEMSDDVPAAVPAPVLAGRRGRILVVDDEPMIATAIQRTIKGEHDVSAVTSGQLALDLLSNGQRFDVLLCDLMMPHMTGMEFHTHVRGIDPQQAERIIFLSGGAFTPAAQEFLANVSNERIEKPFDAKQLRGILSDRVRAIVD
jgi:PAS domain S-box-containing protein